MYTSVIILNYNNYFDTRNCIESIIKYNTANIKITVVDNGSNAECVEQTVRYLKNKFQTVQTFKAGEIIKNPLPTCSYIVNNVNSGYAQGNNEGLKLVYQDDEIDYILIINNDILFIEDIIPKLVNNLKFNPSAGIISPLLLNIHGVVDYNCARKSTSSFYLLLEHSSLIHKSDYFRRIYEKRMILKHCKQSDGLLEIELPSGSCMLMEKEFIRKIGSFDPNTFLYMEEDILFEKVRKRYYKNYINLNLKATHLGANSTKVVSSVFIINHAMNSTVFFMKNYLKSPFINIWLIQCLFKLRLFLVKKRSTDELKYEK